MRRTIEAKKSLLIFLIIGSLLVIIVYWQQTGGRPSIAIPKMVMHAVRKVVYPKKVDSKSTIPTWTWKCIRKQRCERMPYDASTADNLPTSMATCSMQCGSTQLWPQPTGQLTLGILSATFLHQHVHFETTADEPARSLLQQSYGIFNENIAAMIRQSEYWLQKSDLDRLLVKVTVLEAKEDRLFFNTDEGYNLTITTSQGKTDHSKQTAGDLKKKSEKVYENELVVSIIAKTFFGARHGLETLSQLIWWDEYATYNGGMLRILRKAIISDKPKFTYRGLMLDTARNFMPIQDLRRVLDGMSSSKLNVFHWHISDSQSFPLKLPSLPQLALHGAYSSNMVYEPHEVIELIDFARIRGIRVIIEVDTPAHAGNGWTWGPDEGFGDLAVCVNERPWSVYCGEPPCGQLNPENPHVYDVLETLYGDLIDLGTDEEIFHLGGDEVNLECWSDSLVRSRKGPEPVNSFKTPPASNYSDLHDLWGDFTLKALNRLMKARDTPERKEKRKDRKNDALKNIILWSSNLSRRPYLQKYFDKNKVIVQSWGSSQWPDTQDLLAEGYRVLISHVDAWYLDCGFGRWRETGEAACDPYRPWQTFYTHRPWHQLNRIFSTQTSPNNEQIDVNKLIIGGEVCLWSEQVEASSLDARIWPRAAAFAERMWSDPASLSQQNGFGFSSFEDTSVPEDVYTRLSTHRERLVGRGMMAEAMWPRWCSHNAGMCL